MILQAQRQRMTVEEFDRFVLLPENADRDFEYIGGKIVEVVSSPESSQAGARINGFIFVYLLNNNIGYLSGADGGYQVMNERYIPDVGFLSYTRMPELVYVDGYIVIAPDLAVEVVSPTNSGRELRIKVANYLLAGTVVWVADPQAQSVEVYVPGEPVKILGVNDTLDGGKVLPGFTLAVKDIFPAKGSK